MQAGDVFSMNDSSLTVENPDPPSILCITQDGVPIWKGSDKTLTLRMYEANTPIPSYVIATQCDDTCSLILPAGMSLLRPTQDLQLRAQGGIRVKTAFLHKRGEHHEWKFNLPNQISHGVLRLYTISANSYGTSGNPPLISVRWTLHSHNMRRLLSFANNTLVRKNTDGTAMCTFAIPGPIQAGVIGIHVKQIVYNASVKYTIETHQICASPTLNINHANLENTDMSTDGNRCAVIVGISDYSYCSDLTWCDVPDMDKWSGLGIFFFCLLHRNRDHIFSAAQSRARML